jgi:EAL and modified HD-GYP domain-containing signal transduction protein
MQLSVYLARQPIFDKNGQISAYELLYRDTDANSTSVSDHRHATARVLVNALNYIGLNTLTKGHIAFVKIDGQTLMQEIVNSISPTHFVLEILESSEVDDALVRQVAHLKNHGYRFALNHYSNDSALAEKFTPLLEHVDFVKVDLSLHPDSEALLSSLKHYNLDFIAEKIENEGMFESAKSAGFQLFQGYFFAKPFMMQKKRVDPDSSLILRIIYLIKTNAPLDEVIEQFNASPYLTINLLKFIRLREGLSADAIASVEQALILIGRERLANWLELLAYAYADDETEGPEYPKHLSQQATHRAYLMEEIARKINSSPKFSRAAYITGLLSIAEVMFQDSFETLLKQMHVDRNIASALLRHNGELGQLLQLVTAVEEDNIHDIHSIIGQLYLSQEDLNACMVTSYQRCAATP